MFKRKAKVPDFIVSNCVFHCPKNNRCPQWLELYIDYKNEKTGEIQKKLDGKCAHTWNAQLQIETRMAINQLTQAIINITNKK